MGQYTDAMEATKEALALDPDNIPALSGLGLVYMELEEYEEAASQFEKVMSIDPFSPVSFKLASTLDVLNGKTQAIPRGTSSTR